MKKNAVKAKFDFNTAKDLFQSKSVKLMKQSKRMQDLFSLYPELKSWSLSEFECLWETYSQAIYMGDPIWINERENALLAFVYVSKKAPKFDFGTEGMFEDYLKAYAEIKPWESNKKLPQWINYNFLTE